MSDLYDGTPKRMMGIDASAAYIYPDGRINYRGYDKYGNKVFRQEKDKINKKTALFHRDQVIEGVKRDQVIIINEGEKDVLAAESLGRIATTSGSATSWRGVDSSPLHGSKYLVVAHRDSAGIQYARDVMQSLKDKAVCLGVFHAAEGDDFADHTAAGLGVGDLVPIDLDTIQSLPERKRPVEKGKRELQVTWANEIPTKKVIWAWEGRIPMGSLAVGAGREGSGKSSFAIWLTAQITRGTLPGKLYGHPRRVLYVAVEDSWSHTLVPKLEAAGADISMVGRVDVTTSEDDELTLSLPNDMNATRLATLKNDVALLVLDPLMSLIDSGVDTHKNHEVRQGALDPLVKLADVTGAIVMCIAHFNKSIGPDPASMITGSGAFKDVPRVVLSFGRNKDRRVMTQEKNSLGRDDLPSLSHDIESRRVEVSDGSTEVGVFLMGEESDQTVTDLLRESETPREDKVHGASEWLTDHITKAGGTVLASSVIESGREAGHSESSLRRAKKRLGIVAVKGTGAKFSGWLRSLNECADKGEPSQSFSSRRSLSNRDYLDSLDRLDSEEIVDNEIVTEDQGLKAVKAVKASTVRKSSPCVTALTGDQVTNRDSHRTNHLVAVPDAERARWLA
jgi:hypothetical protein